MKTISVHQCENCRKHVDVTQALANEQVYEYCPYCNYKFKLHKKETEYQLGRGIDSVEDLNKIFEKNDIQEWVNKEIEEISKIQ